MIVEITYNDIYKKEVEKYYRYSYLILIIVFLCVFIQGNYASNSLFLNIVVPVLVCSWGIVIVSLSKIRQSLGDYSLKLSNFNDSHMDYLTRIGEFKYLIGKSDEELKNHVQATLYAKNFFGVVIEVKNIDVDFNLEDLRQAFRKEKLKLEEIFDNLEKPAQDKWIRFAERMFL